MSDDFYSTETPIEVQTPATFPKGSADWLRDIVALKNNPCFQFYIAKLETAEKETINAVLNTNLSNEVLRELVGEVRGLRRVMNDINTDEKELQQQIKNNETAKKS